MKKKGTQVITELWQVFLGAPPHTHLPVDQGCYKQGKENTGLHTGRPPPTLGPGPRVKGPGGRTAAFCQSYLYIIIIITCTRSLPTR